MKGKAHHFPALGKSLGAPWSERVNICRSTLGMQTQQSAHSYIVEQAENSVMVFEYTTCHGKPQILLSAWSLVNHTCGSWWKLDWISKLESLKGQEPCSDKEMQQKKLSAKWSASWPRNAWSSRDGKTNNWTVDLDPFIRYWKIERWLLSQQKRKDFSFVQLRKESQLGWQRIQRLNTSFLELAEGSCVNANVSIDRKITAFVNFLFKDSQC